MGSAARYREDEDWELYNDNGFLFKRKKRRLEPQATVSHPSSPTDADQFQDTAQKQRRERKRNILLKLKARYLTEIHHWAFLSATLRALEETAVEYRRQHEQAKPLPLESVGKSVVDEVLLQVQAQESIVHNISNLCDEAGQCATNKSNSLNRQYLIFQSGLHLLSSWNFCAHVMIKLVFTLHDPFW